MHIAWKVFIIFKNTCSGNPSESMSDWTSIVHGNSVNICSCMGLAIILSDSNNVSHGCGIIPAAPLRTCWTPDWISWLGPSLITVGSVVLIINCIGWDGAVVFIWQLRCRFSWSLDYFLSFSLPEAVWGCESHKCSGVFHHRWDILMFHSMWWVRFLWKQPTSCFWVPLW